jgi:multiple sugar transport system substrate-binding protein
MAGEVPQKLQQSIASGLPLPDIIHSEIDNRMIIFDMDISEDLSQPPYNVKYEDFFDFVKPLITTAKGEIGAIDISLFPAAFAYKKPLTKQYLGTDDRHELEAMLKTLDDYVAKGAEINKASGGKVYMFSVPADIINLMWLTSGIKMVNADGSLNYSANMKPGIEFLIKLRDAGAINTLVGGTPQSNASFATDNDIFYSCATWVVPYSIALNDPDGYDRWGLLMPPMGAFAWGGIAQGISKTSQHKAEAWDFIKWCNYDPEGVEALRQNSYYTTIKSYYGKDESFTTNKDPRFGDLDIGYFFYQEMAPEIVPPDITIYNQIIKDIETSIANYIMQDKNVTADMALNLGINEMKNRLPGITIK